VQHGRAQLDVGERAARVLARVAPPEKNDFSVCAASWITCSPSIRPASRARDAARVD